jgi:ankyrin repeat protein
LKRFILVFISTTVAAAAVFLAQAQEGELASLIQAGNRQAALDMIRAGADVNEAQADGTQPIHWAVYRVDYELIEELIARDAQVDVMNQLGSTPLAEAVRLGDPEMVRMLLDAGSGPEGANQDGQTALMLAIRNGDPELVRMLIDAGANVNAVEQVQDQTPLMWATTAGQNAAELVEILLSEGADVSSRAKFTDWPSQITSEPRWQYHAYGGLTVLLYAVREGCSACVESLVAAGADVNLPTPEGVTALMIALDNGHNDVAKWLLDHGANPHVWDVYGRTALYIAIDNKGAGGGGGGGRGGRGGGRGGAPGGGPIGLPVPAAGPEVPSMDIITALLDAGVDPNTQLSFRRPSNQGGRFGDPNLSTGATPLFRALVNNDREVIEALLENGANPNIVGMGATPFLLAAGVSPFGGRGGGGGGPDTELLDLLIEHGADVNAQVTGTLSYSMRISRGMSDDEGTSALHYAVQSGNVEMVGYLLEHGARTDIEDWSGRTPLDIANGVPAKPVPPDLATARVPDPYAPTDVDNVEDAPVVTGGGRGGGGGPAPEVLTEIRAMLEEAALRQQGAE